MNNELIAREEQDFIEWFVANYPGPTVITKPDWHAPKIWTAATRQLCAHLAQRDQRERELVEALQAVYQDLGLYQADREWERIPVGLDAYHKMEQVLSRNAMDPKGGR